MRGATRADQIVAATVEALAEVGHPATTLQEIARRGGLSSTRLIGHHFGSRDGLMAAVARGIVQGFAEAVQARVRAAPTPTAAVAAYIGANIVYMAAHPAQVRALLALAAADALPADPARSTGGTDALERIVRAGVESGEFRAVRPALAAALIQRSLEGFPRLVEAGVSADRLTTEMTAFFLAALGAPPADG